MDKIQKSDKATFAGGHFWYMVEIFELPGVLDIVSGYTGGDMVEPSHQEVSSGETGHLMAVQVTFDPSVISYGELLRNYWRNIDPTDGEGQFTDRGSAYGTAIFFHNEQQKKEAIKSKIVLESSDRFSIPIVTEVLPASDFYPAKEFYQDFYKNEFRYKLLKLRSGRDAFLQIIWVDKELEKQLTPMQYKVTQQGGTEPPYDNAYWDNEEEGIYVDIISGEPLFSSKDKYDAGCGWPSFTKPITKNCVKEEMDVSHNSLRTAVRSKDGNSHLGHVFEDGPTEQGGLRYCINSASLRFIPKAELEQAGYGEYLKLFYVFYRRFITE